MREFVIFEDTRGWNVRICINDIVAYNDGPNGTIVLLANGEHILVRATSMDIDAILDLCGNKIYFMAELKETKGVC